MIQGIFSSTSAIGISSMASISDNRPSRNKSDSPCPPAASVAPQTVPAPGRTATGRSVYPALRSPPPPAAPSAECPLSQNRQAMPHRIDFILEAEHRRIQITQQTVAHGRFRLDQLLQFVEIQFGPRYRRSMRRKFTWFAGMSWVFIICGRRKKYPWKYTNP
jgi:hypothetical protein